MSSINLKEISTRAPEDWDKDQKKVELDAILEELDELQNLLYAESKHSVLIVLQGMDAAGKDGLIRDVFSRINPQGVSVTSFKVPTKEELSHDFLWRIHKNAPEKGMIKVFNRSHYEDILVTRVNNIIDDVTAEKRVKAINDFEHLLSKHNNTQVLKFYLHISQDEQYERLVERMKIPRKMWKYNANDFSESAKWDSYMKCYEDAFNNCGDIPWHIVPSDQNWCKSYIVAKTLRDTLTSLNMQYPLIGND
ncbi:MAG: polyphosphate kinase [Chitinophagales bacterium]|nr:polyphosphate kinase [Chitinophagaceae bacterium]MCB9064778.1 polyphosphate kinase [Chitinophagales bacterium]